jgi:hypothetical protein
MWRSFTKNIAQDRYPGRVVSSRANPQGPQSLGKITAAKSEYSTVEGQRDKNTRNIPKKIRRITNGVSCLHERIYI